MARSTFTVFTCYPATAPSSNLENPGPILMFRTQH